MTPAAASSYCRVTKGKVTELLTPQLLLLPDLKGPRRSWPPNLTTCEAVPGPKGSRLARKQQMGELP